MPTFTAADVSHTEFLAVSLATLDTVLPGGPEWVHEAKLDGYRIEAVRTHERVRLYSRNAHDWTDRFQAVADAVRTLPADSLILDGEIVASAARGQSAFQTLQRALQGAPQRAANGAAPRRGPQHPGPPPATAIGNGGSVHYVVFDLLSLNGNDLRSHSLAERQALLHTLMRHRHPRLPLRVVQRFARREGSRLITDADPLARACAAGLEGLVSKRLDGRYLSGRHRGWIKVKCGRRQEFVVVGFTEPQGSRTGFGALLLAVHDAHGVLQYAGKVGTGFDTAGLLALSRQLHSLEQGTSPLNGPLDPSVRASVHGARWVAPVLVAEISFTEWTVDGRLRHPVFHGLRSDKDAREVVREDIR